MPIITALIHRNGDTKTTLLDQLGAAYAAVHAALRALADAHPHERNYYPEPGRYPQARAQYQARADALRTVAESLWAEIEALDAPN